MATDQKMRTERDSMMDRWRSPQTPITALLRDGQS